MIAINFDDLEYAVFDLPGSYTLAAELKVSEEGATADAFEGATAVTLPPYGIAILLPQQG